MVCPLLLPYYYLRVPYYYLRGEYMHCKQQTRQTPPPRGTGGNAVGGFKNRRGGGDWGHGLRGLRRSTRCLPGNLGGFYGRPQNGGYPVSAEQIRGASPIILANFLFIPTPYPFAQRAQKGSPSNKSYSSTGRDFSTMNQADSVRVIFTG